MPKAQYNDLPVPKGARGVAVAAPFTPAAMAMAPERSARRSRIACRLLGFLSGALFWHAVGFWDFLGGIVYKRQQESTIIERVLTTHFAEAEEDCPLAERERQARVAAQNCTTLVMDRLTGSTASRPCVVIIRNVPQDAETANAAQYPHRPVSTGLPAAVDVQPRSRLQTELGIISTFATIFPQSCPS